jgi:hypothetical protein
MCRLTDVVYRVQLSPKAKPYTVNRYRLWRVSGKLPDDWWSSGSAGVGGSGASAAAEIEEDGLVDEPVTTQLVDEFSPDPLSPLEPVDPVPDAAAAVPVVRDPVRTTRCGRRVRLPSRYLDR